MRRSRAAFLAACVLLGGACGPEEPERSPTTSPRPEPDPVPTQAPQPSAGAPNAAPPADDPQRVAAEVFTTRCATCHGPEGAGDGPVAAGLTPRPRDLRDPDWQASVSDAHIEAIIAGGGAAVGKSPLMPPNPDLADRPDVLAALRETVRGLAKD